MATRECPQCFEEIDTRAIVCPHCQSDFKKMWVAEEMEKHENKMESFLWVCIAIFVLIVLALGFAGVI